MRVRIEVRQEHRAETLPETEKQVKNFFQTRKPAPQAALVPALHVTPRSARRYK